MKKVATDVIPPWECCCRLLRPWVVQPFSLSPFGRRHVPPNSFPLPSTFCSPTSVQPESCWRSRFASLAPNQLTSWGPSLLNAGTGVRETLRGQLNKRVSMKRKAGALQLTPFSLTFISARSDTHMSVSLEARRRMDTIRSREAAVRLDTDGSSTQKKTRVTVRINADAFTHILHNTE